MSAELLREAASEIREYAARGIAWEPEWDGDRAADKGWLAPPVALAVAEAVDVALGWFDPDDHTEAEAALHDALLAVARAYLLGEDA